MPGPTDHYLIFWVADLSDRQGRMALAGYAQLPGADPRINGVVIDPRAFGTLPPLVDAHRLGRTATHEVGHWLNLLHIFANQDCQSADGVEDTPAAAGPYTGSPAYPQHSCGQSSMFMNFMDWVDEGSSTCLRKGSEKECGLFSPKEGTAMHCIKTHRGSKGGTGLVLKGHKKSITMAFKSYLLLAHCNALTTTGYPLNSSPKLLTGISTGMAKKGYYFLEKNCLVHG